MSEVLRNRKGRGQRGQAMVEFALVLPLLLIISFIIVDFGFAFSNWVIITNATREGARYGAVGVPLSEVEQRTLDTSNGILSPGEVTVEYVDRDGNGEADRGDHVAVRVTHPYSPLTPLSSFLSGLTGFDQLVLSSCTDMRLEIKVAGASAGGSGC